MVVHVSLFFAVSCKNAHVYLFIDGCPGELVFAVSCTLIGVFAFAYVVGNFDGIIESIGHHKHEFQSRMAYVALFMKQVCRLL